MPVSTDQYNRLLARITKVEETLNDIMVAMERYITLSQVNQLHTLVQTDLDDLRQQVVALETRVTNIEEEPIN